VLELDAFTGLCNPQRCRVSVKNAATNEEHAMTGDLASERHDTLHPTVIELAEALARDAGPRAEIVRGDNNNRLAIEETSSTITLVEAEGDELRIVPFVGDTDAIGTRPFVRQIRPAWLDGELELVADVSALSSYADRGQVIDLMHAALDYWTRSAATPPPEPVPVPVIVEPAAAAETSEVDFAEDAVDEPAAESTVEVPTVDVQMRADISDQWSWASSAARIPQISDLVVALSEPVEHARISVVVHDADLQFGTIVAFEGPLAAGTSGLGSVHVPLSARVMSQVDERHGAECVLTLEHVGTGRVLARYEEALDIQPRDLWIWEGDPRRADQRERLIRRHNQLVELIQAEPQRADVEQIAAEIMRLGEVISHRERGFGLLSRSLLASFVRPNHPEIATLSREAADVRGKIAGQASFHAFQMSEGNAAEWQQVAVAVDASVTAIYEALRGRRIAYSEPPPGWDYTREGQRIRDHGDVARGGLGTCMDTTVLTAAVLEHVGLHPVLVLIPEHIFIGYWRRNPARSGQKDSTGTVIVPDWYPRSAVVTDTALVRNLVDGGYLGLIETTAFSVATNSSAGQARAEARESRLAGGLHKDDVTLIDVLAARRAGVSPLPAVNERPDGVTEVIEYRPEGGPPVATEVMPAELQPERRARHTDSHPVRYRTWKASLFSLNATNALLNLGHNARVQPIVLPASGLGALEDKLNQDVTFGLHSGYDIPEVWRARDKINALQLLESADPTDHQELLTELQNRQLYVQRIGRSGGKETALTPPAFFKEIRSMAHGAKTARDERNEPVVPLYRPSPMGVQA
jgi:hypothetical protein